MQAINGSVSTGEPIHSDDIKITKFPQENGGVKPKVTTHMVGNWDKLMPGERGIGDIPRNGA